MGINIPEKATTLLLRTAFSPNLVIYLRFRTPHVPSKPFSEALLGLKTRVRSGGVLENYYGVKLLELCFRRVDGSGRKDDLNPSVPATATRGATVAHSSAFLAIWPFVRREVSTRYQ